MPSMSIEATQRQFPRTSLNQMKNRKPTKQDSSLDLQTPVRLISSKQAIAYQLSNNNQIMKRISIIKSVVLVMTLAIVALLASITSIECHIKRTQYHEQGLHGPKSYKFGYTSGDHKNPQERHEVSDGHGHVMGWYSFVDANGKHQVVHYEAHPKYGFKVYNHKSKAHNNGKRHYGS